MNYNGIISTSGVSCAGTTSIVLEAGSVVNGTLNNLDAATGVYNFVVGNPAQVAHFTVVFLCDGTAMSRAVMIFEDNVVSEPTCVYSGTLPSVVFGWPMGVITFQAIPFAPTNGTLNNLMNPDYTFTVTDPTRRSGFDVQVYCDGVFAGIMHVIIPAGEIPPTPITSIPPPIDALDARQFRPLWLSRNDISHNVDAETYAGNRADLRYELEILAPPYPLANTLLPITAPLNVAEIPPYQVGNVTTLEGAVYNVQQYLDDQIMWSRPDFGQRGFRQYARHTMPFQLRSRVLPTQTTATNDVEWVFKGGIDDEDFGRYGRAFFDQYLAQTRQFLTWCPDDKLVAADQPEHLYFLLNFTPLPETIRVRVRVTYTDNTYQIRTPYSITDLRQYGVVSVAVGHNALLFNTLPKTVHRWEVWLNDENGVRVSEIRTYRQDFQHRPQTRYVVFSNSLGGYDTQRFYGNSSEKLSTRRTTYRRHKSFWDDASLPEIVVNEVESDRALTAYTGWLERKIYLKWLQELALSEDVYLLTPKLLRPVMVQSSELVHNRDNEDMIGRVFEFTFVNRHNNYSDLPALNTIQPRTTGWRGSALVCELDAYFKRSGRSMFTRLERFYTDDNTVVKPKQYKSNDVGDVDYLPPIYVAGSCGAAPEFSYHLSAGISQLGTFFRANCAAGQTGTAATIAIAAGRWGGFDPVTGLSTQAKADQRAQAEWESLNTQAYANINGACVTIIDIEAETGQTNPPAAPAASGGRVAFPSGNPSEAITLSITAPVSKTYALQVWYYANANGSTTQADVLLDGVVVAGQVTIPVVWPYNTGAVPPGSFTVSFPITAGAHSITLRVSNSNIGGINFDKIRLT